MQVLGRGLQNHEIAEVAVFYARHDTGGDDGFGGRYRYNNLFSFRMISDTRIECQNANSEGETAGIGPAGRNRGGAEPRSSSAALVDGFLSALQ
jgi:hypothetical protein